MCGRPAQSRTREDYLAFFAEDIERDIPYDPEPVGRYSTALGVEILLLSKRDEHLYLDPVFRGYTPGWQDKPLLISARVETATASHMLRPLWQHSRIICSADGWFEWKKEGDKKQPYSIYRADGQSVFIAVIGSAPLKRGDETEGVLIATAAADQSLVDIHDRRPLILSPKAVWEWVRQDISDKEISEIAIRSCAPANQFIWHPVSRAMGNVKNQGAELIQPV